MSPARSSNRCLPDCFRVVTQLIAVQNGKTSVLVDCENAGFIPGLKGHADPMRPPRRASDRGGLLSGTPGNTRKNGTPITRAASLTRAAGPGGGLNSRFECRRVVSRLPHILQRRGTLQRGADCNSKSINSSKIVDRTYASVTPFSLQSFDLLLRWGHIPQNARFWGSGCHASCLEVPPANKTDNLASLMRQLNIRQRRSYILERAFLCR